MAAVRQQGEARLWSDAGVALALGVGFLGLYLRTLCPTVYLGDVGDFCSAIVGRGVPHPPGYPLFCLLGRAAMHLIPVGEAAFRIGSIVALAAAAAVATLYLLARELACSRWAALAGAVVFGTSYTYWSQSVRVEVYSLHVLLVAGALLGGLRYRRAGGCGALAAIALCVTLGLANHLTIVLILPALLVLCGRRLWTDPGFRRRAAVVAGLLPVGPALYLLLMLWAREAPRHAWGNTVTLSLLWNHATARSYQDQLGFPTGDAIVERLRQAASLYGDNFPYLLCLLPLVGAALLFRRSREAAAGLGLGALVIALFNTCYRIYDIAGYYLVVWMIAAVFLSVALDALRAGSPRVAQSALLRGAVAAFLLGLMLARNWSSCDLSRATWVRDFAMHKLADTDPGSVVLTRSPDDTFPLWYVQDVLGVRPDVIAIDRLEVRFGWRDYEQEPSLWYLRRLQRHGVPVSLGVPADRSERVALGRGRYLVELLERGLRGRAVYATFPSNEPAFRKREPILWAWVTEQCEELPTGLLLRLHPRREPVSLDRLLHENERLWAGITLPDLHSVRTDQELAPDYQQSHYAFMLSNLGHLYEMAGSPRRAQEIYRRVLDWAPDFAPARAALAAIQQTPRPSQQARR